MLAVGDIINVSGQSGAAVLWVSKVYNGVTVELLVGKIG
jgi:hypothetical protein